MKLVKEGSRWWAGNDKRFVVIDVVEADGHTWVHYRDDKSNEPREYSCYLESFLERFSSLPE